MSDMNVESASVLICFTAGVTMLTCLISATFETFRAVNVLHGIFKCLHVFYGYWFLLKNCGQTNIYTVPVPVILEVHQHAFLVYVEYDIFWLYICILFWSSSPFLSVKLGFYDMKTVTFYFNYFSFFCMFFSLVT